MENATVLPSTTICSSVFLFAVACLIGPMLARRSTASPVLIEKMILVSVSAVHVCAVPGVLWVAI